MVKAERLCLVVLGQECDGMFDSRGAPADLFNSFFLRSCPLKRFWIDKKIRALKEQKNEMPRYSMDWCAAYTKRKKYALKEQKK